MMVMMMMMMLIIKMMTMKLMTILIIRSDTSMVIIPELELELQYGTLGKEKISR